MQTTKSFHIYSLYCQPSVGLEGKGLCYGLCGRRPTCKEGEAQSERMKPVELLQCTKQDLVFMKQHGVILKP